ncbi:hypothetical protein C823_007948 [Eubacterium plexicaudatum ASF492]|nr:hypothetical protein C823_007948 [Eubacterium plexicaudatum ASF492]
MCDYEEIDNYISNEINSRMVYLDPERTNMHIFEKVQKRMLMKKGDIVEGKNITLLAKAVKIQ